LEAQSASVVDSVPGETRPTPIFLIRTLVPSHQPPITVAARAGLVCAHACAGTHRAFGPVLQVWAPGNSPAAGHPCSVGNCAHDGSFNRAGVGPAASHAPGVRTAFPNNGMLYHIVRDVYPRSCKVLPAISGPERDPGQIPAGQGIRGYGLGEPNADKPRRARLQVAGMPVHRVCVPQGYRSSTIDGEQ